MQKENLILVCKCFIFFSYNPHNHKPNKAYDEGVNKVLEYW